MCIRTRTPSLTSRRSRAGRPGQRIGSIAARLIPPSYEPVAWSRRIVRSDRRNPHSLRAKRRRTRSSFGLRCPHVQRSPRTETGGGGRAEAETRWSRGDAQMGKQTRRKRKQSRPPADSAQRLTRSAKIWLTTVSTVVAIATGMFTLRDQVFPHAAGTATAESVVAYQQQVGRVCDEVN